ncbi:MAG: PAS domain S-box protein, partial [Rhodospirillaceae bacterium]|nr:PAS domain S-box protein [Rhodospirillaceae bacterium]
MLEKNNNKLNLACAAVAVAVLLFDLSLPLGVAGGVPYVALVLLGMWAPTIRYIYFLATLGTALTIVGYVLSDAGGVPWVVLVNRGLAFFVIWTTAILLALRNQGQDALARSRDDLEGHALQHTIENRENEDRYRAFSDLSSEGVAIINGGTIIEANQAFASMYGYSISKLIGKPVLELVVPEQREN